CAWDRSTGCAGCRRPDVAWIGALARLPLASVRRRPVIALDRTLHALAIAADTPVAHVAWPGIDHMRRRVRILGVACAQRDGIAAMDVLSGRTLVDNAAAPAASKTGRERQECQWSNNAHGNHRLTAAPLDPGSTRIMWP